MRRYPTWHAVHLAAVALWRVAVALTLAVVVASDVQQRDACLAVLLAVLGQ